jgi:2,5-diketo-D-gluconate reductase B
MIHLDVRGHAVPALGFGTWQLKGDAARASTLDALEIGYRHIDTAQMYKNEAEVGRALAESYVPRGDLFLTTKVWRDDLAPDDVRRTVEASLEKLGTDYVDLLLIHWPNDAIPLEDTLGAFLKLREEGRTKLIGVSNFPPALVRRALEIVPDLACDQVEHHVYLGQSSLRALAEEEGLMLTAYSPLAQGQVFADETLKRIGEAHGKSAGQVALRWLLQHERTAAIPKAASHKHRVANFDLFDFALTDAVMAEIDGLEKSRRLVDPGFAPAW